MDRSKIVTSIIQYLILGVKWHEVPRIIATGVSTYFVADCGLVIGVK